MFEIGNSLREARVRQGIDYPTAEAGTRIRSRYLRAMEDEDFDLLPDPSYVRGFLRAYATYLGIDPALVLDEYESRYGELAQAPAPPAPTTATAATDTAGTASQAVDLGFTGRGPRGSYLEVRAGSATGATLYSGVLVPGATRTFTVPSVAWVRIGNPRRVTVAVDGQALAIGGGTGEFLISRDGAVRQPGG